MSDRSGEIASIKRELARDGYLLACEVCGWHLPASIPSTTPSASPVTAHHVIPVAAGGEGGPLVLLCPNHHAVAHRLWHVRRGVYDGPREPAPLIAELRDFDSDPDGYMHRRQLRIQDAREAARRTA